MRVSIGANIKRLRKEAGFKSQRAFADKLGVDQPRLNDWERSRYGSIELPNLLLIAKALKKSVDEIVRAHFRGRRAPRKSKKAMKKFYAGAATTPRERRRVSRLTFVAV